MRYIVCFLLLFTLSTNAQETCSRIAIINYQEVLVDTNSTQKGEGLRFHLEKDEVARQYLDKYQEGTKIKWQNVAIGTLGTTMLATGLLINNNKETKNTLLIGGATFLLVNFLVAKTLERNNEENLTRAIEEYNKRNLPHIYLGPDIDENRKGNESGTQFFINKNWSF